MEELPRRRGVVGVGRARDRRSPDPTTTYPLAVSLDVDASTDRRTVPAGRVGATLLSAGAWVGLPLGTSVVEASLGLGVRAGVVRLSGEPSDGVSNGHVAWRPWAGPAASARVFVGGRFGVDVGVEAGMSLFGAQATANGQRAAAATGPYGAVSLGFSMKTKKR